MSRVPKLFERRSRRNEMHDVIANTDSGTEYEIGLVKVAVLKFSCPDGFNNPIVIFRPSVRAAPLFLSR